MLNQVEVGYKYKLTKLTLRLVQLHGSTHKVTCKYSNIWFEISSNSII